MPDAAGPLILGIDLGTSAIKVVVVDAQGAVRAEASAEFDTVCALPGQAEQDPEAWLEALAHAVASLDRAAGSPPQWRDRIAAIGLCGQLPTLVCVGAGVALGPAITWKDARADDWAAANIDGEERRALYARTGMPIDGRYLGPMWRAHRAARSASVDSVLSAKDFLAFAMTGVSVTDPSTAAGYGAFDLVTGSFAPDLCARWGLPVDVLPAVRPSHSLAGPLNAAGARLLRLNAGIPVTVGAADSVAGAYATTGLVEGSVCIAMGSSTIIVDAIAARRLDGRTRYLLTPHVVPGWYGREMDLLATGTGYRWLSDLLGWRSGELDARAADVPAGARGVTFAPYLAGGEQGALWDPTLRGEVRGLTLQHGGPEIARAFLEGVAFEIRRCVEVLAEAVPVRRIVVSGHIVDRPTSLQLLADVLGRPVEALRTGSPAALGAALGARPLAGLQALPPDVPREPATVGPGAQRATYAALYDAYIAR